MFVHLSIHYPRPGKEDLLIESMRRFGAAILDKPGCRTAHALRDQDTGRLIGLAVWDSEARWKAARPAMEAAVAGDPFEEWELRAPEVFHLDALF